MKILKFIRTTYCGDEYLIENEEKFYRIRFVDLSTIGDPSSFLNTIERLRELNLKALILPERVEIGDTVILFYPFRFETELDVTKMDNNSAMNMIYTFLNLMGFLSHLGISPFVATSFDDVIVLDDFYLLLPPWWNLHKEPKSVFYDRQAFKLGKVLPSSSTHVMAKMLMHVVNKCHHKQFASLLKQLAQENPEERPKHVTVPQEMKQIVEKTRRRGYTELNFPPLGRSEDIEKIFEYLEKSDREGFCTIAVRGKHGIGKTTFLEILKYEFLEKRFSVLEARSTKEFLLGLGQIAADKLDDPEFDRLLMEAIEKEEISDKLEIEVKKIVNSLENLAILVDDFHEAKPDFRRLIKSLMELRKQGKSIITLSIIEGEEAGVKVDHEYLLPPLKKEVIDNLMEMLFPEIPAGKREELSTWLMGVSNGIPGIMVEVLKTIFLNVKYEPDKLDLTKLGDIHRIIKQRMEMVPKEHLWVWERIALLGLRFVKEDVKTLTESLDLVPSSVEKALNEMERNGVVYQEKSGIYKFTLDSFWKSLVEDIPKKEREKIYRLLLEKTEDPQRKGWYLERLNNKRAAAALYIKEAIKAYRKEKFNTAKIHFEEATRLLGNGTGSYAIATRLAKIYSNVDRMHDVAFKTLNKYSAIPRLEALYKLEIFLNAEKVKEASKLLKKLKLDDYILHARLHFIAQLCRYQALSGDIIYSLENLSEMIEDFRPKTAECWRIYALALLHFAELRIRLSGTTDRIANKYLKRALGIAESRNFKFEKLLIQAAMVSHFSTQSPAYSMYLIDEAVKICEELGIKRSLMDLKLEHMRLRLYKGQKEEFLRELREVQNLAYITNDLGQLAQTLFDESFYHAYNKEFEDALQDLNKALELEKKGGFIKRALRAVVTIYAMKGDLDKARELIKRRSHHPALTAAHFANFRGMIEAKSDEEFLKYWSRVKHDGIFWNEETLLIFAERLIELDEEGFLNFAHKLEEFNAKNGMLLSLAIVYESLGKAFWKKGAKLSARRFFKRAYTIYESSGFKNAARILKSHPAFQEWRILKTSGAEYYQKLATMKDEALFIVRYANLCDSLEDLLRYFTERLRGFLPIEKISMVARKRGCVVAECGESSVFQETLGEFFSQRPFRLRQDIRIDTEHTLSLYLENNRLNIDKETFEEYLEFLEEIEAAFIAGIRFMLAQIASITDPLTGLYTRWFFTKSLKEEFERAKRYGTHFSVIMADIDNFKVINDTYGHTVGDRVLEYVARVFTSNTRATDIVGRYGGEEFIVLLPNTDAKGATEVAEKLRRILKNNNPFPFPVTMSFGVASFPESEVELPETLVALADKALYTSKAKGKNRVTLAS